MYVIRTQKLASYLMNLGFRLIRMDIDRNNPNFNVFLFNYSDELIQAVNNYKLQLIK
jgi:hypothetical protein